jgi:anti-sigma B factor antagonist
LDGIQPGLPASEVTLAGRHRQQRSFEAQLRSDADPTVVVRGEIDIATADRFEKSLQQAASLGQPIVIDLRDTTFMDSTGLSVLVRLASTLGDPPDPSKLVLESPQPAVRKTLTVSGIDRIVTIRDAQTT